MKMEIKWSKEQEEALRYDLGNTLVSASAGSGKTAVLTERVFRILKTNVKLNEILVLTFTNLAAQEMRDRIRDKLVTAGLNDLASNVDAVNIQTYDAYALAILSKYQSRIGLYGKVKVVDKSIIDLQIKKTLRTILDKRYIAKDKKTLSLIYEYCLKNDDNIIDLLVSAYNKFDLRFDKKEYLDNYINKFYDEKKIRSFITNYYKEYKKLISDAISYVKCSESAKYADKMIAYLSSLENIDDLASLQAFIHSEAIKFPSGDKKLVDEYNYHIKLKDEINCYHEHLDYSSLDEIYHRIVANKEHIEVLIDILKELDDLITKFKKEHYVYTFNDIFKMAMQIVKLPDINEKLKKQYKYIMIDEYQDTSPLQEEFISSFANNNVYAVGDIKQSIYRFRNADCTLFQNKFDKYQKGDGGTLITLFDNYRSRKEVIDNNNQIFAPLMNKENTGLDYINDHMMRFGSLTYESLKEKRSYNHEIIRLEKKDNMLRSELEARTIAFDIVRRMKEYTKVRDKDGLRDIEYSDFAILSYAKTNFSIYQKVFSEYGIPLFANYENSLNDNDVTLVFKNIIKCIVSINESKYNSSFRHAFISILRSFLFSVKDQEIEDAFYNNNFFEYEAYKILKEISSEAKNLSLEDITRLIVDKFDFYDRLISVGDIAENKELIKYFYTMANAMDEMNFSLSDYALYFDELDKYEIDQTFKGSQPAFNSVKIMTIHASKGLQFKYVYYVGLNSSFLKANNGKMLIDDEYGIDLPNRNYVHSDGYFHDFIAKKEKIATINEQLRVFYVALTRAEEKAILLMPEAKYKDSFLKLNCYFDFFNYSHVALNEYSINIDEELILPKKAIEVDKGNINILSPFNFKKDKHIRRHISKEKSDEVDSRALELGNKFHYYLELVNFASKDTSFIKNNKDRQIIDKFLKNTIFDKASEAKICHEYAFYDEENDVYGIIDLMLIYDDHIDIIDYKLSHVDDEDYVKQVNAYRSYIKCVSGNKKINVYILGILSGLIKEVKE